MIILYFLLLDTFAQASIELTHPEKEWISQNPVVTFTGDPNWLPYEAFDQKRNYIGIVSQHLHLIEQISGLKFKPIVVSTWNEAQHSAMEGKAKIISGDSADAILNQKFNPVDAYSHNPIVIIMNIKNNYVEDLNQIRDKKIAIIKDYGYTANIYKLYPDIEFIEVQNIQEGLIGLSQGRYDAMLATMALASYSIAEMNIHNLKVVGKTPIIMDLTLFVSKEEPLLHSIITKSLQQITPEQKQTILQKWIKNKYVEKVDYTIALISTVFLAVVIAIILFWTIKLKKEIDKRRALQEKYKRQLELNRLYLNTADVLMLALDREGNVTMLNRKGQELLALGEENIINKSWFDLGFLPKNIEENYRKVFSTIINQQMDLSSKVEHPLISRKGESINLLWRNALLIDQGGKVQGTLSSAVDITQKRIEEKVVEFRYRLSEISHQRDRKALIACVIKTVKLITDSKEGKFTLYDNVSKVPILITIIDNDSKVKRLNLPVIREGVIVASIEVWDKEFNYTQLDANSLTQIGNIAYDYMERIKAENQINFMAYNDSLTHLPNRLSLSTQIDNAIQEHLSNNRLFALCFIDLDGFKPINDTYGHDMGDKLLIALANRFRGHLRENDIVSRLGGDEFVVIFTHLKKENEYINLVQRLLDIIEEPFMIEDIEITVSASIGITLFPIDQSDTDKLLRHADKMMYQAKENGAYKYKRYLNPKDVKIA